MNNPRDDAPNGGRLPHALWTALAVAWLFGFCLLFYNGSLPNVPGTTRPEFLRLVPVLLLELVDPLPMQDGPPCGWRYLPQRFDLLLVAVVVYAGAWGAGRCVWRMLGPAGDLDRLTRNVFALGLGLAALSLATLGCGLLGWLWRPLFGLLLGVPLLTELVLCLRSRGGVTDPSRVREPEDGIAPEIVLGGLCVAAVVPFLLTMLLGAALPPIDFDVKEYHLQGPKEHFQNGRVTFLPHNVYTSFPFLTEMLSLLAMVLRGDWFRGALAGKLVLMGFAPLTGAAIFAAGRRWFGVVPGSLGAMVYLTTPWTYQISVTAWAEGGLSCYLFLSLFAAMLAVDALRQGAPAGRWCLLTGLLAGSAMACKYPGALSVVIPLGGAIVVAGWKCRTGPPAGREGPQRPAPAVLHEAGWFVLGVLVAVGPWLLKNLVETGNPVYPLLYSLFGGRDWDPQLDARWVAAHGPDHHRLGHLLSSVVRVVSESDWLSPLPFAFAPLALLVPRARRRAGWLWAYVAWLFVTWWAFTHRIDRFWVPMLPVVSLLAGAGAAWTARRAWQFAGGVVIVLAVGFNLALATASTTIPWGKGAGGPNAGLYVVDLEAARAMAAPPAFRALEPRLGADARVLTVGEAEVFDARFPLVYDTVFDRSIFQQWTAEVEPDVPPAEWLPQPAADVRGRFAEQGITHVLVNWSEVRRYRDTYGFTPYVRPEVFRVLREQGVLGEPLLGDETRPVGTVVYPVRYSAGN